MDNNDKDLTVLRNIVRVGTVSSVDVENRTARVAFHDKQDTEGKPLISGPLKVIQNQPLITVEKWVTEVGAENKWDYEAHYASAPRNLGLGESYTHAAPDVIKNSKVIQYEKRETISEGSPLTGTCSCPGSIEGTVCPLHGIIENKPHRQTVTVYPWLPYVGQFVLCLFLPNGESDGFVMGGI